MSFVLTIQIRRLAKIIMINIDDITDKKVLRHVSKNTNALRLQLSLTHYLFAF